VSVVIPAYNAAAYVVTAANSALQQTHGNVEVIVVNDGSTDSTADALDSLGGTDSRLVVIHQRNAGPSAARNAAIHAARGEYMCFLDADDVFLPDKVERQVRFLEARPDVDLVYSDVFLGDEYLEPVELTTRGLPPLPFTRLLMYRNWFWPISPLLRMSLVRRTGPFDEALRGTEDWDYWTRCARTGEFAYLPGAVGIYRRHASQASQQFEPMRHAQSLLIEKHYGNCSSQFRSARAARHFSYAKALKRQPVRMLRELALFFLTARDIREIRLIAQLV
jgi:glycosyltransferase involved in cell wall biosynthesis